MKPYLVQCFSFAITSHKIVKSLLNNGPMTKLTNYLLMKYPSHQEKAICSFGYKTLCQPYIAKNRYKYYYICKIETINKFYYNMNLYRYFVR